MTGGDTNHYTTEDLLRFGIVHSELIGDLKEDFRQNTKFMIQK